MRNTLWALSLIIALATVTSSLAAEAKDNVIYKPAPEGTLHYNDGVTVHRHSDGSVEVSDPPTTEPLYPNQSQSRPVRRAVRKRVATKKAATTTKVAVTKKNK